MKQWFPILFLLAVLFPSTAQAVTPFWTISIGSWAMNGTEQPAEATAIWNALPHGTYWGASNYRNSYYTFLANGYHFTLNGVDIGPNITVVHMQDWAGIATNACVTPPLPSEGQINDANCTYYATWSGQNNLRTLGIALPVPPPTSSLSVSPNPVPVGGNPGFTLSSTNAYYCYVWVNGSFLYSGYSTSGTYYYGSFTSPGSYYAQSYCYNSDWAGSGWTGFFFNVNPPPPTASVSISENPVPYGGNPAFTLSSTNAYYCSVLVDWATYILNWNYTTSGTYYYGAFTSPGSHLVSSYCYNSAWIGAGWFNTYFTVNSPPTSSVSVSPNPVPYSANPGITLSSTNSYYCHVYMDWSNVASGYFTSGTYYPGSLTSPGTHSAETYCYNSAWQNPNGWTVTYFTVDSPPTSSVSVSQNPVPYSANPAFTLSSTNGYYCYVLLDWSTYLLANYTTSGTYYYGAFTSPGSHVVSSYCYNSVWSGQSSGWSNTYFTVNSPPTSSLSISQNPVPYGGNPGFTLSSSNAYYCYVWVDGTYLVNGYTTSGTYYYGAFTSPGSHYAQSYCYNSAWSGSGWSGFYFSVDSPPTSSLSVSPNPVPYNSAPTFTLSSTNAYYCHVLMDGTWTWNVSGYFGSGAYSPGAMTSPGAHSAWSYCYNSAWQNPNGWSITNFSVDSAPSATITSVSPNPVPYGGNPGFTLATTNGYYSYILMDGVWNWYTGGYFTSGTYYPGALTSPGSHTAWAYTYNPAWIGSGWSTTPFTVGSPPTSSVSVSPNPVPYGTNPAFTLSSTNGYYCYVQEDGNNLPGTPGYFTSGTFYPGAQTSPGTHSASSYCYNSAWNGSGWTSTNFTVNYSPLSVSCSGAPGNPYYGQPVTWSSSVSGGSGTRSYSWSSTDGLSGTASSVQKTYATSGQKNATVVVTDSLAGTSASATCSTGTNQPNGPTNGGTCTTGVCPGSCTGSLTASPSTVEQGQTTSLTWSVTGGSLCAASCSGSGFNTGGAISGTTNASVPATPPTTSYALSCVGGTYGPPPTTNTTVTVLVPTATITANGQYPVARVSANTANNVTVAWTSANSSTCSVTKNGSAWKSGTGSSGVTDTVTTQTAYAIDCVNSHGTHAAASVLVNILPTYKKF